MYECLVTHGYVLLCKDVLSREIVMYDINGNLGLGYNVIFFFWNTKDPLNV